MAYSESWQPMEQTAMLPNHLTRYWHSVMPIGISSPLKLITHMLHVERLIDLASKVSLLSDHHTHKIGCVLFRGNRTIAVASNMLKTHPLSPDPYQTQHAEFRTALLAGFDNIQGASIFLFRKTRKGDLANARPCPICMKFIQLHGIVEVAYTIAGGVCFETIS